MVFIGYEEGAKCYRVYNPMTKKLQVTRDVLFEESRPWNWDEPDTSAAMPAPPTFTVVYATGPGEHELDTGGATHQQANSDAGHPPHQL